MKILVLDNYDSFTYNLVHIIRELGYGQQLDIYRNDKITLEKVEKYDKILLSPGPGIPSEAGIMLDLIDQYAASKSILGICLGHQGIAEVFGATLYNMPQVLHGVGTEIRVVDTTDYLFRDIPHDFLACRYHSWAVVRDTVNGPLNINSEDKDHVVMGINHAEYDVRGLQFHPESVLTEHGKKMMKNWLDHPMGH
jgi:anthranilate synthase component 2